MKLSQFKNTYNEEYIEVLNQINEKDIEQLYNQIKKARDNGKTIYMMGNGGSATSASHWVCDFTKGTNVEGKTRIKMICLNDNTPTFSAFGNDVSYDDVFVEQLINFLEKDDLVVGLSVSGNSENIVRALKYTSNNSGNTFSIIGDFNGNMKKYSDSVLEVPSKNYGIVEDVHMYVCHLLSQFMYEENK